MNIQTTFAILNTETNKLLQLEQSVDFFEDMGIQRSYTLEDYGDFGDWETNDLSYAFLVREFKIESLLDGKESPNCLVDKSKTKIVAIHRINDSLKIITSENVPQSIFDIVKDNEGFLYFLSHDNNPPKFSEERARYFNHKLSYETLKIDSHTMTWVCNVLKKMKEFPEINVNRETIKKHILKLQEDFYKYI